MDVNTQPGTPQQLDTLMFGRPLSFWMSSPETRAQLEQLQRQQNARRLNAFQHAASKQPGSTVSYGGGGGTGGGGGGGGGGGSDPMGLMNQMGQRANSLYWNGGGGQGQHMTSSGRYFSGASPASWLDDLMGYMGG